MAWVPAAVAAVPHVVGLISSLLGGGGGRSGPDYSAMMAQQAAQAAAERAEMRADFDRQMKAMQAQIADLMKMLTEMPKHAVKVSTSLIERTGKTADVLLSEARARLGIDAVGRFNIAIPGKSGSGKSTFINALLGPDLRPEDYAPVGETETTMVPKAYNVPGTRLTLWDLPGWGTATHPSETYFMDKMLYAFDAMVVMYSERFPEGFKLVADGCKEFGVNFVVVRNKCDLDMASMTRGGRGKPPPLSHDAAVTELRSKVSRELASGGSSLSVMFTQSFLISAKDLEEGAGRLDEARLMEFVLNAARSRA